MKIQKLVYKKSFTMYFTLKMENNFTKYLV